MTVKSFNIFNSIFRENKIPKLITSIGYKNGHHLFYQSSRENEARDLSSVYSLRLIPDYLRLNVVDGFHSKQIKQENKGFAIDLESFDSVEQYIKKTFGKKYRQIFRRIERLEACFNIRYAIYYGKISKEKYVFLMDALKEMLVRRFNERGDENHVLDSWNKLYESLFPLINSNRASFFVTYNGEVPIQISLQYHFDKILYVSIPGYDIDYYKFGLGNLAQYKQLEWCEKNKYKYLDLGHGHLEFKQKWSNCTFCFKHQIFYKKKSLPAFLVGHFIYFKILLKEYIKSNGAREFVLKLKSKKFEKYKSNDDHENNNDLNIVLHDSFNFDGSLEEIGFDLNHNLKKIAVDFIYTNEEHIDNVKIFKVLNEKDTYLLKGNKRNQKFSFSERS